MALVIAAALAAGGCLGGPPGQPASPPPLATPPQPAESATALARAVHQQVNAHRAERGQPALQWDGGAAAAAREHSQAMADGRIAFGHDGFDGRAAVLAAALPVGSLAENVAYDGGGRRGMVQRVVDGWLRSSGHRRNIEGEFHATGVGVAAAPDGRHYFTQIFVQLR